MQQPQAQVIAVQPALVQSEICCNSGHTVDLFTANPGLINFVGNTQKPNYGNDYNKK